MTASRFLATLSVTFGLSLNLVAPAMAGTSLVVDASSGAVLSSENSTQAWHPASTTKMMTAYLALKAVKEGRLGLETAIPASKRAASQPRVKVYIRAGQEITLDNALRIMMVKSANDIAYVIAEGVGGDVETFVGMMNAQARALGMNDSHFVNPNGWHHPDQQVSARDLAVLAMALMRDFPEYADYWNTGAAQLGKQILHNTNGLVGRYAGISGMKTGFVCASGFNVVATATRGGRTLIAVVMGALSGAERTVKAAQLLDEGFGKWGGMGATLAGLPSGSGGRAYSICDDVRRKGGGAALADDVDVAGPISQGATIDLGGNADGTSDRFMTVGAQPRNQSPLAARSGAGRITLGPRADMVPVQVSFGRTPGSALAPMAANATARPDSLLARGSAAPEAIAPSEPVQAGVTGARRTARTASTNGAIPRGASAFAPAGDTLLQPPVDSFQPTPLRLQGAIQPGAATPTTLRPSAAAGIKAKTVVPAKVVSPAKVASPAKPVQLKATATKPSAGKPQSAKSKPAAPTAKTKPKAKPADDA